MKRAARATLALMAMSLFVPIAIGAEALDARNDESVFVFGGPMSSGFFGDALVFWNSGYEPNYFAGAGYQRFFHQYQGFALGLEAGIGIRAGQSTSAEAWAGVVGRLTEFEFGPVNVTPSITGGFSVVTDTIGVETTRTAASGDSATVLYYLAPEIAVSHDDHPQWEAFGRIQHRSGGFGTIAHIDGSNAVTAGLRYKF